MKKAILAVLLLASAASATDGGPCDAGVTYRGGECLLLCDGKSGTGACNSGNGIRIPEMYGKGDFTLEISKKTACTACTVLVQWSSTSTGVVKHDIFTLDCTGDTSDTETPHFLGYLFATVATQANCTDLDVKAHFQQQ